MEGLAARVSPQYRPQSSCRSSSVVGPDGQPLKIAMETAAGVLRARIWRVEVGRTTLLLLDFDLPENSESYFAPTATSWRRRPGQDSPGAAPGCRRCPGPTCPGDPPLGVPYQRAAHTAFATLEMIRVLMESTGLPFAEVMCDVVGMTVFTTQHSGPRRS